MCIVVILIVVCVVSYLLYRKYRGNGKTATHKNTHTEEFYKYYYNIERMNSIQINKIRDDLWDFDCEIRSIKNSYGLLYYDNASEEKVSAAKANSQTRFSAKCAEKLPKQIYGCITYGDVFEMVNECNYWLKKRGDF